MKLVPFPVVILLSLFLNASLAFANPSNLKFNDLKNAQSIKSIKNLKNSLMQVETSLINNSQELLNLYQLQSILDQIVKIDTKINRFRNKIFDLDHHQQVNRKQLSVKTSRKNFSSINYKELLQFYKDLLKQYDQTLAQAKTTHQQLTNPSKFIVTKKSKQQSTLPKPIITIRETPPESTSTKSTVIEHSLQITEYQQQIEEQKSNIKDLYDQVDNLTSTINLNRELLQRKDETIEELTEQLTTLYTPTRMMELEEELQLKIDQLSAASAEIKKLEEELAKLTTLAKKQQLEIDLLESNLEFEWQEIANNQPEITTVIRQREIEIIRLQQLVTIYQRSLEKLQDQVKERLHL